MGQSLAFRKIRSDVLGAAQSVPPGCLTTYGHIGDHLEVQPRHVSYILATLTNEERRSVPWHRVTGKDGLLSAANGERLAAQSAALHAEGHLIHDNKVADFASKLHAWPPRKLRPGGPERGPYSDPQTPPLFPPRGADATG